MSFITKIIMLFLIIFDLSFTIAPKLSTGKIVIALLFLFYIVIKNKKMKFLKIERSIFIFYFFIALHVLIIFVFNEMPEITIIARIFYYIIYSIILPIILVEVFEDKYEFIKVIAYVVFIQSCFVLISWISEEYRIIIQKVLVQTGNISLLSAKRPPGFMNSAGAMSSVILGIGTAMTLYLIIQSRKNRKVIKYSIMLVISLVATFIVGRTGLILLFAIAISILWKNSRNRNFNIRIFILSITLILFISIVIMFVPADFIGNINFKVQWILSEFNNGLFQGPTVTALSNMSVRDLNWDTFIGTSKIRLTDGQHDSGYIQSYHAMGLLFSMIFYVSVFCHLMILARTKFNKILIRRNFSFILVLIAGVFVVEIKEPFILSYMYPMIVFTLLRLPVKEFNQ